MLDVVFVVDSSGSINDAGSGNWDLVRRFIVDFIQRIGVSPSGTHVGLVLYRYVSSHSFRPCNIPECGYIMDVTWLSILVPFYSISLNL